MRTQIAHLLGKGPAAAQVQYALKHAISPSPEPVNQTSPLHPEPVASTLPSHLDTSNSPTPPAISPSPPDSPPQETYLEQTANQMGAPPTFVERVLRVTPTSVLDGPDANLDERFQPRPDADSMSEHGSDILEDDYDPEWDRVDEIEARWAAEQGDHGLAGFDPLGLQFDVEAADARELSPPYDTT